MQIGRTKAYCHRSGHAGGVNASVAESDTYPSTSAFTVVVPSHNGGERLLAVIGAIAKAVPAPANILVADDGSDDGSPQMIAERYPDVRVIRVAETPVGPSAARNVACEEADTPIIVFVDADVLVLARTFAALLEPLDRDGRVVATFGSYDANPPETSVPALYGNLRHHTVHQVAPAEAETFWSGLGAVRRDVFLRVGGFDTSFGEPSIEDVELGTRLRALGEIRVVHAAQAKHLKRWTLLGLWKTDVLKRAVPWGRLAAEHPTLGATLNASGRERLSAGLVALIITGVAVLPFLLARPWFWTLLIGVMLLLGLWCVANVSLLCKLRRCGGTRALLGGGLLHVVYYIYAPGAYLLSLAWHRWRWAFLSRDPVVSFVVFIVLVLAAVVVTGISVVGIGAVSTEALHARVSGLQDEGSVPRYDLTTLAAAQNRLLLLGLAVLGAAAAGVVIGPKCFGEVGRSAWYRLTESVAMNRACWLAGGLVSIAYFVLGLMYVGQQMRLDEAASFSMFAGGSPLVAVATYDTPNNHVLHSILMWTSVQLLGPAEWSARLPAFLAAQCIPICMIAFATRLLRPTIGIVAAALYVGSPIGIDIATNARGYPFVIVAMLLLGALLPALWEQRPGARPLAIAIGALGIYACPVMAYPLAAVYACWAIRGLMARSPFVPLIAGITATGMGTLAIAALAYSPAWALRTGRSPVGVIGLTALPADADAGWLRLDELVYNVRASWAQWTAPMPTTLTIVVGALVLFGLAVWLARRESWRALGLGLVLGPLGVYVLSGFAPPPWWILVWIVPLLATLIATPIVLVVMSFLPERVAVASASVAVFGIAASGLLLSNYPKQFPYRTGLRDAPAIVEKLLTDGIDRAEIVTNSHWHRLLNFELEKRGQDRGIVQEYGSETELARRYLIDIRAAAGTRWARYNALELEARDRVQLLESTPIGVGIIDRYEVISNDP